MVETKIQVQLNPAEVSWSEAYLLYIGFQKATFFLV